MLHGMTYTSSQISQAFLCFQSFQPQLVSVLEQLLHERGLMSHELILFKLAFLTEVWSLETVRGYPFLHIQMTDYHLMGQILDFGNLEP